MRQVSCGRGASGLPFHSVAFLCMQPSTAVSSGVSSRPLSDRLPPYSPSVTTPSYSPTLLPDEECLELTARARRIRRATSTSVFEKRNRGGDITLKLTGQEDGLSMPCYGRDSLIKGHVALAISENIQRVDVKVCHRLYSSSYSYFST